MGELTKNQKHALLMMYYSGFLLPTNKGYVYQDYPERADMRSVRALIRRGLVAVGRGGPFPGRAGQIASIIGITPKGEALVERGKAQEVDG